MDKSKHPSLMEHQHMYKRTWREPTPTLDSDTFKVLWKKQRLAEIRDAILRGDWPHPVPSDSDSSDDDGDNASTNSSNSPGHHKHHHHSQDSDEDPEFEEALQEAADAQLHVVLASLKEQHERELQGSRAAAQQMEEEHTATTKQMADIQAQLDELKREKHELFQQLKLVNQAAAREAAAAAAAAQQAAFQQQQRQWQQHQQMPPPPSFPHLQQGQTPFHAASYGGQPFPAGSMHPQQPQSQPTTPRVAGQPLQTSSSGMMSPAARGNWPCSSPQQPPPPPPPRHVDGGTPSYQQQQQQQQRMGSFVPPAFQQQHHQQQPPPQAQQQYGLGRQGSWAGAGPGQQQQQQQQQQGHMHQPLGRAQSDAQYWASAERGGPRLDRMGSDRLERLSSSGFDGPAHAAAGGHHVGREGFEQQRQAAMQPPQSQQQQQPGGVGTGGQYGRSPREGGFGRGGKPVSIHELQAPDSPEEGEALPSPPGPAIRKQIAAQEARAAAAAAAAGGVGAAGGASGGAGHFVEPSSAGTKAQRSPRVGLDRAPSGKVQGAPGGSGGPAGTGSSGGGYRVPAAHTDAVEQAEGGRGAAHAGAGGPMLTGLRRSSSGGSTLGLHALTSPPGAAQRLPSTPSDPITGRSPCGAMGGVGGYRGSGMPGSASGPGSAGGQFGRGREEGGSLPTPWQNDRRRSSNEGWDRFGAHGHEGGSGGSASAGPGAGKPWGRLGGRGRGVGGYQGRG